MPQSRGGNVGGGPDGRQWLRGHFEVHRAERSKWWCIVHSWLGDNWRSAGFEHLMKISISMTPIGSSDRALCNFIRSCYNGSSRVRGWERSLDGHVWLLIA